MNRGLRLACWIGVAFALLLSGLAVSVLRLALEGERAMARSDVEFDQGRLRESLLFARRAAALYAPGLGHVRRADQRLYAIAIGAESSQRQDISVLAWQAIRSSELQRRWVFGRPSDRARMADRRLVAMLADDGRHGSLFEQQHFSRLVLADLEGSSRRSSTRNLGRVIGLGAIATGLLAIRTGLGDRARRRRWLWVGIGFAVFGTIAWAICLSLA